MPYHWYMTNSPVADPTISDLFDGADGAMLHRVTFRHEIDVFA